MKLEDYIANVPNFPKEGIQFKDITTLVNDKDAFKYAIDELANWGKELGANVVIGPDARGFIIPVRKPGKLPRATIEERYDLEYGSNTLCIHADAIKKGDKVLIIDDLMATGGTVKATVNLVKKLGGEVVGVGALIELEELHGKDLIKGIPFKALVKYDI